MVRLIAPILTAALMALGCGASEPDEPGEAAETAEVDGGMVNEGDEKPAEMTQCGFAVELGSPIFSAPEAVYGNQPGSQGTRQMYRLTGELGDTGAVLSVELWDTFGVFADQSPAPGIYEIAGDETSQDTCGICLVLSGTHDYNGSIATLLAQSGTIELTATEGILSGSVSDLTFIEVGSHDPDEGLCSAGLTSATFSAPITIIEGGGGGGGGSGGGGGGGGGNGGGG